jgi:hypothetical protein
MIAGNLAMIIKSNLQNTKIQGYRCINPLDNVSYSAAGRYTVHVTLP